jgi:hypothetical protein
MNLVFTSVFFNDKYLELLDLLLESVARWGNLQGDFLVCTHDEYQNRIHQMFEKHGVPGKTFVMTVTSMFEASAARLHIFEYPDIEKYEKILYIDTDVLITNDLKLLLDPPLENKLYALKEDSTRSDCHGRYLFDSHGMQENKPAFCAGVLLFNNCQEIRDLFGHVLEHIRVYRGPTLQCLEQPFIIFNAFKYNVYDNEFFTGKVINNPSRHNGEAVSHFCGGPGDYESKISKMSHFLQSQLNGIVPV